MPSEALPEELMAEARAIATDGIHHTEKMVAKIARALRSRDERAAGIARDRGPATQDMTSTMICDALEEVATAILSPDTPKEPK